MGLFTEYFCKHKDTVVVIATQKENPKCVQCGRIMTVGRYFAFPKQAETYYTVKLPEESEKK